MHTQPHTRTHSISLSLYLKPDTALFIRLFFFLPSFSAIIIISFYFNFSIIIIISSFFFSLRANWPLQKKQHTAYFPFNLSAISFSFGSVPGRGAFLAYFFDLVFIVFPLCAGLHWQRGNAMMRTAALCGGQFFVRGALLAAERKSFSEEIGTLYFNTRLGLIYDFGAAHRTVVFPPEC